MDKEALFKEIGKTVFDGLSIYIGLHNLGCLMRGELENVAYAAFIEEELLEKICIVYEDSIQS